MKSILVQLDEPTLQALNRIAPARDRRRSEFIREAIRRAVRASEYAAMRKAYRAQPEPGQDADDWANAGPFRP